MTPLVPLIESYRGGTLECRFFGAVAVVDTSGKLVAQAGDPHWVTFTRSALKALQAMPFVRAGGPKFFDFSSKKIAMMCSSHSGEPMHVEQVQGILDKAGLTYKALKCGCHVPYYVEAGVGPAPDVIDERHHNCSGKHSGFLAACVHKGWPVESYLAPDHPLQQAIRRDVASVVGMAPEELKLGIDGCSAPNFAMPLSSLARGYARLATGAGDSEFGESFEQLSNAMTAHPELVSGTNRSDKAFMNAGRGDWVTKAGADGVQAVASRSRKQGFAVKISDGNKIAVQAATVAVLDQLGWMDQQQKDELRAWEFGEILNTAGLQVGERKSVMKLEMMG